MSDDGKPEVKPEVIASPTLSDKVGHSKKIGKKLNRKIIIFKEMGKND